jgi:uncharacterized membrane protein
MAEYKRESQLRSFIKGLSWRVVAMLDTFIVALVVTWIVFGEPKVEASGWIMLLETPLKLLIYYVHERLWQTVWKDGKVTNRELIKKTISWRIIATTMTLIISGQVLGDGATGAAIAIAITELISKTLLYYVHEKLWLRAKLGTVRRFYRKIKSQLF